MYGYRVGTSEEDDPTVPHGKLLRHGFQRMGRNKLLFAFQQVGIGFFWPLIPLVIWLILSFELLMTAVFLVGYYFGFFRSEKSPEDKDEKRKD